MLNLPLALMRLCLLTSLIALAFCGTASAQENPPVVAETGALNALLHEVRLWRVVLQNVNTSAKRIQLATERIRLQQERVDKLLRDLEETRMQLTGVQADQKRLDETLKELERQMRQEAFPARRLEIEKQLRVLNIELEPLGLRETRLKEREGLLLGQLSVEQAKLTDLNGKLDALEKVFEAEAALENLRRRNAVSVD